MSQYEIKVKMLGKFSVSFEGREIALSKNTVPKYMQLLWLIWLSGSRGISKMELEQNLYGDTEMSNLNNSFNNLLYQLRLQMVKAGLPECDYIVKRDGLYYTDPEIKIDLDVDRFTRLYREATENTSGEHRMQVSVEALELCTGLLLPQLRSELWVIIKNNRIEKQYAAIVDWAGEHAKVTHDYRTMLRIYELASKVFPNEDYQTGAMEALIALGETDRAYKLYIETARYYSDELGVRPSDKMLELFNSMSEKFINKESDIDQIKTEIEASGEIAGEEERAYFCSYPGFIDAYHVINRNMGRRGFSAYMMLCTLLDYEGKRYRNEDKLRSKSDDLKEAIFDTLRKGDTFTKYSDSQYLILLMGASKESCEDVYRRILVNLKSKAGIRTNLAYNVVSVADLGSNKGLK